MQPRLTRVSAAAALAAAAIALTLITPRAEAIPTGGYLSFDGPGAGYMEVPDDPALNPADGLTVEAWVWLEDYAGFGGSETDCPMIVGKNWVESYALALACGGDVMDSFINGQEEFAGEPVIPLQTWTHLAMTYTSNQVRRDFVNGELVLESAAGLGLIGDTDDPLRIGNDVAWDYSPHGRIDDVRIWSYGRSGGQIRNDMNKVENDAAGLVARWTFGDGSLTDVVSGFTGALSGDASVFVPTPTPSPTPTPPYGLFGRPGDVDCDAYVALRDAMLLLEELALAGTPYPCVANPPTDPRDANCDGLVNGRDVLEIMTISVYYSGDVEACPPGTPTSQPTPTPSGLTSSPSPTPTGQPSETPTPTPTPTATPTASPTPPQSGSSSASATATPSPTATASPTLTASPTASPTPTPSPTPSPTPTPTASPTPTPSATVSPTPSDPP